MATYAPVARMPFAPVDNSRLQQLSSAKNSQNGLSSRDSVFGEKANGSISKAVTSPTKRPFDPSALDDFDSENIDPAAFSSPSKKSKSDLSGKPFKPFTFSMSPINSMPPPPTVPCRPTTPAGSSMPSQRPPMTAPAGRSPKRKAAGLLKNRRVSAPFSRIDPPLSSRTKSTLPFSLDAAINGTFSKSSPRDAGATIQESMPKNWFFDIYEDTPEEEAANLMEHSTLTLDLSSDEESNKALKDDRGKENTPPEDYDAPTASRSSTQPFTAAPQRVKKTDLIRKKVESDKMDDGERSPLSDLETDYFIPEGLDKDSHIVVNAAPEKSTSTAAKVDVHNLFATAVSFVAGSKQTAGVATPTRTKLFDMPLVTAEGEVKGDIIVWEDSPSSVSHTSTPTKESHLDETKSKDVLVDENSEPLAGEVL